MFKVNNKDTRMTPGKNDTNRSKRYEQKLKTIYKTLNQLIFENTRQNQMKSQVYWTIYTEI